MANQRLCKLSTLFGKAFAFAADGAAVRDSAPPRPFKMGRLDLGGTVGRSVDEQTEEKRTKLEQFAPVCSQVWHHRTVDCNGGNACSAKQ